MTFKTHQILFIILYIFKLINCAEIIDCLFTNDGVNVNYKLVRGYGCTIQNIQSIGPGSAKEFRGTHKIGKSDESVKFISYDNTDKKLLEVLDSSFCQKFNNLEIIQLNSVMIETIDENSLRTCKNLKIVTFESNELRELPEILLVENTKLLELKFRKNPLTDMPENFFGSQQSLEKLFLSWNQLSYLPDNIFKPLTKLKALWLGINRLQTLNAIWFENLRNLEELDLSGNQISEISSDVFRGLVNLKTIWLGYNQLKTLNSDLFDNLKNIKALRMGFNKISELPKDIFVKLTNLEELLLDGNQLTTIHSDSFGSHKKLTRIVLENNKLNEIDERVVNKIAVTDLNMAGNLCSQDWIKNKNEMRQKLQKCFENYKPRLGDENDKDQNEPQEISIMSNFKPSDLSACGKSMVGHGNIIGGNFISRGSYPWIAALVRNDGKFFCGGTIISNQRVVTAAHCIYEKSSTYQILPRDFSVSLGVHNLDKLSEVGKISVAVQTIHLHPSWNVNTKNYDADIAVLILEEKIEFNKYIQPICLMTANADTAKINQGVVVGYGKSEDESKLHENIPKILKLPIHKNEDCFLKNWKLVSISSKRTFCGGSADGSGVCNGDSGSGFFVTDGNNFYLRGIVSASLFIGSFQCNVHTYSVFTDVLKFSDWILNVSNQSSSYE